MNMLISKTQAKEMLKETHKCCICKIKIDKDSNYYVVLERGISEDDEIYFWCKTHGHRLLSEFISPLD